LPIPQTPSSDAYGAPASALLRPIQADLATLVQELTGKFYGLIPDQARAAEILRRLRPHELDHLRQQLARYLIMLLSDGLSQEAHRDAALKAGRVHALAGIESRWLVDAYAYYQEEIHKLLREQVPDSDSREVLLRVIAQRFQQDVEAQASSQEQIADEVATAASRISQEMMSTGNLTDLIRSALEIIGTLPGGVSVFFARVDDTGVLQIEQSYGDAARKYHAAMESGNAPKISVDPENPSGRGPGGRAWRCGEIVVSDAWLIESDKAPWLEAGKALGFRSSAAVPILDESGQSIAMLSLYNGWPGYFSNKSVRGFLGHAQQVLSYGIQQRMRAPVIPMREQSVYRELLAAQRIVMHYQPVISLRDGSLVKIEGLSRLCDRDNRMVPPHRFLPTLGQDELRKLFQLGLEHICRDLRTLHAQGMDTKIAINLPAKGLDDPAYQQIFFDVLGKCEFSADHFQLEILETQDMVEKTAHRQAFIQRLKAAGVGISQDDLGSGHSSLLRLDTLPFDEVKIDQGLVRSSLHDPKRALDFILHLTRLAHAFSVPVTVEGLENEGVIEAAATWGRISGRVTASPSRCPWSSCRHGTRDTALPPILGNPGLRLGRWRVTCYGTCSLRPSLNVPNSRPNSPAQRPWSRSSSRQITCRKAR